MSVEELHQKEVNRHPFLAEPIEITKQTWPDILQPLVSIHCIAYMHENYIRDAIEGFLMQQTTFKVEIWIHDDASTDNTANIIREYEKKHPQLFVATYQVENQYKKNPKTDNYIKPPPRRGKYIAMCEGDDYWTDPLKLQKQVEFLEGNEQYVMCYHYNQQRRGDRVLPLLIPRKSRDFSADELIATPDGIATATKVHRNIYTDPRLPEKVPRGDYGLNALLGIFGACKFMPDIKPSIRRLHDGGVWSSKSANSKSYGIINTKIKIYTYFREIDDNRRANISLRALYDAIEENLFVLEPGHKEFKIGLNRTRLIYNCLKLDFYYRPLLLNIRRLLLRITKRK
jgi:glycosyltransferase involved in cell wall biosynthesis